MSVLGSVLGYTKSRLRPPLLQNNGSVFNPNIGELTGQSYTLESDIGLERQAQGRIFSSFRRDYYVSAVNGMPARSQEERGEFTN